MNKISKKIICILIVCSFIVVGFGINRTYAATAEEELIQVLDEYKNELGDIEEFKKDNKASYKFTINHKNMQQVY